MELEGNGAGTLRARVEVPARSTRELALVVPATGYVTNPKHLIHVVSIGKRQPITGNKFTVCQQALRQWSEQHQHDWRPTRNQ